MTRSLHCFVVLLAVSCASERRTPPSDPGVAAPPGTLSVVFEEPDAIDQRGQQLIVGIITESENEARALLPTLPSDIEVTVAVIDRDIDVVGGVSGRADAPGRVRVLLSRAFPGGIQAAAQTALAFTIFHELHHLDRGWTIEGNLYGPGIPIAAVNEGLASVFAETYTDVSFDEAYGYPEDAHRWLEEVLALPDDADYEAWVMGEHPDGRTAIGYRVGRYIIHQAEARSGMDILELSKLAPDEILALASESVSSELRVPPRTGPSWGRCWNGTCRSGPPPSSIPRGTGPSSSCLPRP